MAQLFLLIKLRILLGLRRYSDQKVLVGFMLLFLVAMLGITFLLVQVLANTHDSLEHELSFRLQDLTALTIAVFLVGSGLLGFRGREYMDVSLLFHYPIRPLLVFLSTVAGHLLSPAVAMLLPLLAVPPLQQLGGWDALVWTVPVSLLFLVMLYSIVQCLVLVMLNVLRSRRFGDLMAILAPLIGLGVYVGLRYLFRAGLGDDSSPAALTRLLESIDLRTYEALLPPLWYTGALYGDTTDRWLWILALLLLTGAFSWLGLRLTVQAFHGEIALESTEKGVRQRGGPVRRLLSAWLLPPVAAIYEKELIILRREPWFRMMFLNQLGLVVLILLGATFWGEERSDPRDALYSAGLALVFVESGFLLNILGHEGHAFAQTAALPVPGFQLLLGKNLAHLQILATVNLVMVPAMAVLAALLAGSEFPGQATILVLAIDLGVLPVLIGAGNLVSVFLPVPFGRRGRRALGQERTGNEGCLASFLRSLLSLTVQLPAIGIGFLIALPVLLGKGQGLLFYAVCLPVGVLFALGTYAVFTLGAATRLKRKLQATLARLM